MFCLIGGLDTNCLQSIYFTSQLIPQLKLWDALLGKMTEPSLLDLAVRYALAYWARRGKDENKQNNVFFRP